MRGLGLTHDQEGSAVELEFMRARSNDHRRDGASLWLIFAGSHMLLHDANGDGEPTIPVGDSLDDLALQSQAVNQVYLGELRGVPCVGVLLPDQAAPDGFTGLDLRALHAVVDEPTWHVAALAFQLTHWLHTSQFCPRDGHPTRLKGGEWAMECPECRYLQYPRVHPCTIVLVHDGDRVLMTRQPGWPAGRYGLVAGFVEPGETLEECLAREVREETGLEVTDMQYFASQSWPFPHQLMVGFTARYAGGSIVVDTTELEDARWFNVDDLPILPPPLSIARRIIDAHVATSRR